MSTQESAIFGAGCFWGVQSAFDKIAGVISTTVGYCGGDVANPDYKQVCTGLTGHAETVEVIYDPEVVSFQILLEAFFRMHNPTEINRQGLDIGTQYRSVIFVKSPQQAQQAQNMIIQLDAGGTFKAPVATTVEVAPRFWPAEEHHQKYFEKNPDAAVCNIVL